MTSEGVYFLAVSVAVLLGALGVAAWRATRAYLKFRGTRVVVCPETLEQVAVEVDAAAAALTASSGHAHLRLQDCSRWPEREKCGQECLTQIEAAPESCLLRTILSEWYRGQTCAYCGKVFGAINWIDHKPALLGPDRATVEWGNIGGDHVADVLATHLPVCWDCHIAETFRREHGDLVTDRPSRPGPRPQ